MEGLGPGQQIWHDVSVPWNAYCVSTEFNKQMEIASWVSGASGSCYLQVDSSSMVVPVIIFYARFAYARTCISGCSASKVDDLLSSCCSETQADKNLQFCSVLLETLTEDRQFGADLLALIWQKNKC
jgi:hypothetical protein